ncbi:MAG: hypothetical protein HDS25_08440 [Bacteroides sp.]|nr:hypothetical protein [Bacteroides sp.]
MEKLKVIAYYLPQFHRLKFNDDYWGKGFTEWTNTAKAKPLFKGHYQPHVPADLGFYDLTVPSVRKEQADLAKRYGIDGFCYWHYWFGKDKPMMERPFNEVVDSGEPNFPFCLAWANHDWHDLKTKEVTIKQEYDGESDYYSHFKALEKSFHDKRYMRIDGRPIFVIFSPFGLPNPKEFFNHWNKYAEESGLNSFYFIGIVKNDSDGLKALELGYDGINTIRLHEFENNRSFLGRHLNAFYRRYFNKPFTYPFEKAMKYFWSALDEKKNVFPTIISGWDHTPRSGKNGLVLTGYTPKLFGRYVRNIFSKKRQTSETETENIIFIRAWNEWAEGNHLEPDLKYGLQFLEELKGAKEEFSK